MDTTAKMVAAGKAVNAPNLALSREKIRKGTLRGEQRRKGLRLSRFTS